MNALKLTILGLAASRLTQLVVDDEITEPVRNEVHDRAKAASYTGLIDKVDTAINCHACTSVWAGGGVLAAESAGPVGRFAVRALALSQVALLVKAVIDRIER